MSININGKLRIKGATTGGSGGGTPNYTFKTTAVGGTNYAYIQTSTGYIKFNATVYNLTETGGDVNYTLDDPNGEYTLVSCDEFGTPSGDITILNLEVNQITNFNGTGLSGLVDLNLMNNQLTSFDGTGLSLTTSLQLDGNQLTLFSGTGLSSLSFLGLTNNGLTSLNGFTFPSSLTELTLNGNSITSYDFTTLPNLTILVLENNGLTSLSGFTFPSSLTTLFLNGNSITSFNSTGLSNLTGLYLGGNQLTSFDASPFTSLNSFGLVFNPLDSADNDSILAQLDDNGVENGEFFSSGGRTSASDTAYNNLIGKGWTIDVNIA